MIPSAFDLWVKFGHRQGWAQYPTCSSHDGVPMSLQEELDWDQGNDPCLHVIRLCESLDHHADVADNTPAMKYRSLPYERRRYGTAGGPVLAFLMVTAPFLPGTVFKIGAIGAASLYFLANS